MTILFLDILRTLANPVRAQLSLQVEDPVGVQFHCVVSWVVGYGSVKGVCGVIMDRVVPILAMASLSMSPVDF